DRFCLELTLTVLGTFFASLEILSRLILNIHGAITLAFFTPLETYGVETELEVTGFDKAFVSPILGRISTFGCFAFALCADATKYRSMIGALMYLTSSQPDIVHATCLCAWYQAKPTEKHLKEVKMIFCYLRGTVNTGLWYTKDSGFELTGFLDADYAGCKDTFKSTSGGAQFLGKKLVSWSSMKQDCMALSTAKAEYVSLSACCAQVLWMRTQLTDYGLNFTKIPIYCDLKSAIAISCNPVQHSRTKHIAVRYHFIKEHVEKGMIELYFIKTDYQLADIFTKALPADHFNYLVRRLGMRSLSPQELERLAKSQ
nr:copia protein [Tanacetum cinerariifolium]